LSALLDEALGLKGLARAGWGRVGIDNPESVAAHAWGVCWLVVAHAPSDMDTERALKIAVVHDLIEVRVGDITPHDGISRTEKSTRETQAAQSMFSDRPDLLDLWQEYEDNLSAEAQFVHDCDKLDMALQALRYAREQGVDTSEFIQSARRKIQHPALLDVLNAQQPSR
jgi:putative hydrolases of HD superfamily